MKLHERDWCGLVVRSIDPFEELLDRLQSEFKGSFRKVNVPEDRSKQFVGELVGFTYTTREQHFLLPPESDPDKYFAEEDHPVRIGRAGAYRFRYPGYALNLTSAKRGSDLQAVQEIALLVPYVRLARELWLNCEALNSRQVGQFAQFRLGRLIELMQTNEECAERIRLRVGRIAVKGDTDIRKVRLSGNNLMESFIYKWLLKRNADKGRQINLEDDSMRIHFHDGQGQGVAVYLDHFGNLRVRPGKSLALLAALERLYRFLGEKKLIRTTRRLPTRRITTEEKGAE